MNLVILIAGILNLGLGLFIWSKGKRKKMNIFFALFSFATFLMCLSDFIFRYVPSAEVVRWAYAFAVISPNFAILWLDEFCQTRKKIFGYLLLLPGITFFLVTIFSSLVVQKVNYLTVLGYRGETGILFKYYSIYIFLISSYVIVKVYFNQKTLKFEKIQQLRYVFLGILLYSVSGYFFSLFLPSFLNNYNFTMLDAPSTLFFVGFSAYAITHYRFMGAKFIYSNIFIYFLLSLFLVFSAYISTWIHLKLWINIFSWQAFLFAFPLGFIVAFLFIKFIKITETWSDRLFYRGYNPRRLAKDLVIKASQTLDIEKLSSDLISEIKKALGADRVGIVLFLPKDVKTKLGNLQIGAKDLEKKIEEEIGEASLESYKVLGQHVDYDERKGEEAVYAQSGKIPGKETVEASNNGNSDLTYFGDDFIQKIKTKDNISILNQIKKEKTLLSAESGTENQNKAITILVKNEILLVIPLISRNQAIGAVFIGKDASIESISAEDVEFLTFISSQIAASIANAYLAENMEEIIEAQTGDLKKKSEHMTKLLAMRSEFLDVASHQLRTPISVIKGMSSMFYDGSVKPETSKQFVEGIFVKSMKLADIIDDILKANEIETEGEYAIALSPTEVKPILERVIKEKIFEANEKKVKLELGSVKADLPKVLSEDEALIRVIKTLVSNALIYTKEGSVKLSAIKEDDHVIIRVTDTGIGIPKEDIPKLFHKFARAKNATHAYADGSGLGLYIAKKIIDAHKEAEIYVEKSELGKGTVMAVRLGIGN